MSLLATSLTQGLAETVRAVVPIGVILAVFQFAVLRRRVPHGRRVAAGAVMVVAGLALFIVGLEAALFPIGRTMAEQLTSPEFLAGPGAVAADISWWQYYWVFLFAAAISLATTLAEPALIAVGLEAEDVSGGTVRAWPLRVTIAIGVGVSVALSMWRIVVGAPLFAFLLVGYTVVAVLTMLAPRSIVPLAYDSGGVTTSTVTVPIVTALGLGLASTVPGRSELEDGFGVIALAVMFPMIAVMGYARLSVALGRRSRRQR
ncbi:MAG: DUF1538 domain-containing protein [Thermoleophilia bacterium]|nr:DUF1538 domain-containing protein [Thermoleophilia bacterium]MDH4346015.1 DUF1538 domain-containing protein [Thermoleophilia bacterium]